MYLMLGKKLKYLKSKKRIFVGIQFFAAILLIFLVYLLSILVPTSDVHASATTKSGTFNKRSGTGSQSITGLGFEPKAIIFYWTRQTTIGLSGSAINFYGSGFVDDALNQSAVSHWSDQATVILVGLSTDSGRRSTEAGSILIQSTNGAIAGQANVTSLDSDGFTLNWSTSDSNQYIVHYVAIGGDDITDTYVDSFSLTTSGGTQSITNPGFTPDALMFLSAGTGSNDSTVADGKFLLGFAAQTGQVGLGSLVEDGVLLNSATCAAQRTIPIVLLANTCNNYDALANVSSFDASGFTVNKTDTPSANTLVYYLAIEGGSHEVGMITADTSTGNQTITNLFQPNAILLAGRNKTAGTTVANDAYISLGSASAADEESTIASNDPDGSLLISPTTYVATDGVYLGLEGTGDTVTRKANLVSFNARTTTINWTTNNGTAVQLMSWAIGDNPTFEQASYRIFENDNSTDVGNPLAAQNTSSTLAAEGAVFRVRMALKTTSGFLPTSSQNFVLQYVEKGTGTCASPAGTSPATYTNVTTDTHIAFFDNSSATDGTTLTSNVNDPTVTNTVVYDQTYVESSPFTNTNNLLPLNTAALWDFSLIDHTTSSRNYCLRIAYADGTALETYTNYPLVQTIGHATVDVVDQSGVSIANPTFNLGSIAIDTGCQTITTTFSTTSQKIRIENTTQNPSWSVSFAATQGPTSTWATTSTENIDFNDPDGCTDGTDDDLVAGQLQINPLTASIGLQSGCSTTGISLGTSTWFSESVQDSASLIAASAATDIYCYWDITDIQAVQVIPAGVNPGVYSMQFTVTLTSS